MVSTKTAVGSIGILAHHEPVLAMLDPTELRLYKTESEVVRFAQAEGYLQVADNHALILVEEATAPGDLDAGSLRERLQQAERELESAGDDTENGASPSGTRLAWSSSSRLPRGRREAGRRPRAASALILPCSCLTSWYSPSG